MIAQDPDMIDSWKGKGSSTYKSITVPHGADLMHSTGAIVPQCLPPPGLAPEAAASWSGVAPPGTLPMGLGPPGTIPVSTPQGIMFMPPLLPTLTSTTNTMCTTPTIVSTSGMRNKNWCKSELIYLIDFLITKLYSI